MMKLNKMVVAAILRLVENPNQGVILNLIRTGSIFRYLACQEQLGKETCDALQKMVEENISKLPSSELINVYRAVNRGLVGSAYLINYVDVIKSRASAKPSSRMSVY